VIALERFFQVAYTFMAAVAFVVFFTGGQKWYVALGVACAAVGKASGLRADWLEGK
jgi:hypothetical protein